MTRDIWWKIVPLGEGFCVETLCEVAVVETRSDVSLH